MAVFKVLNRKNEWLLINFKLSEVHPMLVYLRGVRLMKRVFWLMIAAFTLAGCEGGMVTYKGDKIPQQNFMVRLQDGNQQGEWKTNELAIKYQYLVTPETLKITGTVELVGGFAIGFNYINHLAVNLLFLDNQGNVIKSSLVYAGSNNLSIPIPMPFERIIPIPEGAQQISFSYDGELIDATHDRTSYSIWFSPT
jgi:hypothetical protein